MRLLVAACLVIVGSPLLGICEDRPNPASRNTSPGPRQAIGSESLTISKVSSQKTIEFWKKVHQSPNIVFVFTDPLVISYIDGSELNQFDQYSAILRKASIDLLKIPSVGVHPDLVEWNAKASILLELRAFSFDSYNKGFKNSENPLGAFNLVADSIPAFLKKYSDGESPKSAAARAMLGTLSKSIEETGTSYQAVRSLMGTVVREKYALRSRISNQLGVELPLDDEGSPIITYLIRGGPAEKIVLQHGDILIAYNDVSLANESFEVNSLADAIEKGKDQPKRTLHILRNGAFRDFTVPPGKLGFEFRPAPPNLRTPWDDRLYMRPKGFIETYPREKTKREN